uniref:U-limacoditoxin(6)-Dv61 n=1 Tax=Doratifera vulnerans TaxID=1372962 RepID=U661_DORVU|nr:RecName: Full=U-limacoditoxin(6)-Dv61; Short=U-LCTX(6)-Dv61; AltName: Full=Vulnericin; Flags: Precursor [Doratifera vulnerans]QTY40839.1 venom polypeptide precursor [Doratifera vulnerans]
MSKLLVLLMTTALATLAQAISFDCSDKPPECQNDPGCCFDIGITTF